MKKLSLIAFLLLAGCSQQLSLKDAIIAQTFCRALGGELVTYGVSDETRYGRYTITANCSAGVVVTIPISPNKKVEPNV
jgi:hypothetical protein